MSLLVIVRNSAFGQILRFLCRTRVLRYPDEKPQSSECWEDIVVEDAQASPKDEENVCSPSGVYMSDQVTGLPAHLDQEDNITGMSTNLHDMESGTTFESRHDEGQKPSITHPIPQLGFRTISNTSEDTDSENPLKWSTAVKVYVATVICIYTFTVYLGSSIGLASSRIIMLEYDVSSIVASLVIAGYVFGYGAGAILLSPISETPTIGRNTPYIVSFALFLGLSAVVATSQSFVALVIARFFQGFVGSPALATGAASMQDMFANEYLPFAFAGWMGAATLGPAFGPTISAYVVHADEWRRPFWVLFWLTIPVLVIMFIALPETLGSKIEFDRRRRQGSTMLSPSHRVDDVRKTVYEEAVHLFQTTLYRPVQIVITHPAVAFANLYTCLIYGLYYTFFESFPRVYIGIYNFDDKQVGLAFFAITLGTLLGTALFLPWAFWWARTAKRTPPTSHPERCLVPGLYACFAIPCGLLIFAWTSRASIHWSISLLGVSIFTAGVIVILQCLANYLILVYEQYAASLFAGNDFMRASLASGAVVFSQPLYANLGVDKGVSILAATTALCIAGMFLLYNYGETLRRRARPVG